MHSIYVQPRSQGPPRCPTKLLTRRALGTRLIYVYTSSQGSIIVANSLGRAPVSRRSSRCSLRFIFIYFSGLSLQLLKLLHNSKDHFITSNLQIVCTLNLPRLSRLKKSNIKLILPAPNPICTLNSSVMCMQTLQTGFEPFGLSQRYWLNWNVSLRVIAIFHNNLIQK